MALAGYITETFVSLFVAFMSQDARKEEVEKRKP